MRGLDKIVGVLVLLGIVYLGLQFMLTDRERLLEGFSAANAPPVVASAFERAFPGATVLSVARSGTAPNSRSERYEVRYRGRDKVERQATIREDGEILSVADASPAQEKEIGEGFRSAKPQPKSAAPAKWED